MRHVLVLVKDGEKVGVFDDEQVHIAIRMWFTGGVGTKKNDLLWVKMLDSLLCTWAWTT